MLKNHKNIQIQNFFAGKNDIFDVDRGWYNVSIMEHYVVAYSDLPVDGRV